MIEKTVFSDDEIVAQIKSNYNIITKDIEHEDRGSANIFYITDDENKKYVFKEFESRCKEEKILKEEYTFTYNELCEELGYMTDSSIAI